MEQARIDAKARGEKVYEGIACKHGHGTTRYVSTGGCTECGRKSALAAYHKRQGRISAVTAQEPTINVP